MTYLSRPLTCPTCGSAIGSATVACPSCLETLVDPWGRFEQRVGVTLIAFCVAWALRLAGSPLVAWLHPRH